MKLLRSIAVFSLILGMLLGTNLPAPSTKAEINTDEDLSVDVTNCSFDYYSTLFDYGYRGSRLSYFSDMWELSYCQVFDMLALYDDLEQLRENFKAKARSCQDTTAEYNEYKKLMMEAYFIRNVWPYKQGVVKLHQLDETEEEVQQRLDDLEADMWAKFVILENYVDETLFRAYYKEWTLKYQSRIEDSYVRCDEGPWSEVTDVVDNFMETMVEIAVNFQKVDDMWRDMRAEQKEMVNELKDLSNFKPSLELNTGDAEEEFKAWREQFSSVKGESERSQSTVDYPRSFTDLGDDETQEVVTLNDALRAIDSGSAKQELHENYLAREARYNQMYGQNGSLVAQDLSGIVRQMNRIVREDVNYRFPKIKQGLSKVYDMQCSE